MGNEKIPQENSLSKEVPELARQRTADGLRGAAMETVNNVCSSLSAVEHKLASGLEHWGRIVARRPFSVAISTFCFALICISGVSMLKSEDQTENLWTPIGAKVLEH